MQYDVAVVLNSKEESDAAQKRLAALLGKEGFAVTDTLTWGKRKLAYPIKKQEEGLYFVYEVTSGPPASTRHLYSQFRLDDTVLRSLVLLKETGKKSKKVKASVEKPA